MNKIGDVKEMEAEKQINELKLFLRIQTQTVDDIERLFEQGRILECDKEEAILAVNKDTDKHLDWFYK